MTKQICNRRKCSKIGLEYFVMNSNVTVIVKSNLQCCSLAWWDSILYIQVKSKLTLTYSTFFFLCTGSNSCTLHTCWHPLHLVFCETQARSRLSSDPLSDNKPVKSPSFHCQSDQKLKWTVPLIPRRWKEINYSLLSFFPCCKVNISFCAWFPPACSQ